MAEDVQTAPEANITAYLNPKIIISVDMPIAYITDKFAPGMTINPAPTSASTD